MGTKSLIFAAITLTFLINGPSFSANLICHEDWETSATGPLPELNPANDISRAARPFWGTALGDVGGVFENVGNPGKAAVAHIGPYTSGSSYSEPKFRFDNTIGGGQEIYIKFDLKVDSDLGTSNATREIYNFKFVKITDYSSAPTTTPDGYFSGNINLEPSDAGYSWYARGFNEYYFNRATVRLENHIMDNQWHTFEVYINLGSAIVTDKNDPNADGIVRVWEDGILILEDTTVPMRTEANYNTTINSAAFIRHAKSLGAPVADMDGHIYYDNLEVWDGMPTSTEDPSAPPSIPQDFRIIINE